MDDALSGITSIGFDTAPLIYFIERHPDYIVTLRELFRRVDAGIVAGISSVVTLTEVLTKPKQTGNQRLEREYRSLLLHSRNVSLVAVDTTIAERAADLRARWRIRTPDALQIATAIDGGCQAFVTNDYQLRRVTDIQVIELDDLEL